MSKRKEFPSDSNAKDLYIAKKQRIDESQADAIDSSKDHAFYHIHHQWLIEINNQNIIQFTKEQNEQIEKFYGRNKIHQSNNNNNNNNNNKEQEPDNHNKEDNDNNDNKEQELEIEYNDIKYSFYIKNDEMKCSTPTKSDQVKVTRETIIELKDDKDNEIIEAPEKENKEIEQVFQQNKNQQSNDNCNNKSPSNNDKFDNNANKEQESGNCNQKDIIYQNIKYSFYVTDDDKIKCFTSSSNSEVKVTRETIIELKDKDDSQIIHDLMSMLTEYRENSNISKWFKMQGVDFDMYPITIFDINGVIKNEKETLLIQDVEKIISTTYQEKFGMNVRWKELKANKNQKYDHNYLLDGVHECVKRGISENGKHGGHWTVDNDNMIWKNGDNPFCEWLENKIERKEGGECTFSFVHYGASPNLYDCKWICIQQFIGDPDNRPNIYALIGKTKTKTPHLAGYIAISHGDVKA